MNTSPPALKQCLLAARRVLIATHINPDGDALGSAAALAHIALRLKAEVRIFLPAPVPDFLHGFSVPAPEVRTLAELGEWTPDILVFVDCGDAGRAGPELAPAPEKKGVFAGRGWENVITVNIDHHCSNKGFADINWVGADCSATGELIGQLAEELDIPLAGELGEAIYLALVSDTGNFSFSNTSADCLGMASRIVRAGLDIAAFTNTYENNWNLARMHLWGRLMSEISLHENDTVAVSIVPRAYLDAPGLGKAALEGFASWLRRLRGVRVGLFVREDATDFCKISLRSMGDVNVQAVASLFGGGGHASAAGAEICLPPEKAAREVLSALRPYL